MDKGLTPEIIGAGAGESSSAAGHQVDAEILDMLKRDALTEPADDGFVTALRHNDGSGRIERIAVYAWGPSAEILARTLGIVPGQAPARSPRLTGGDELKARRQILPIKENR